MWDFESTLVQGPIGPTFSATVFGCAPVQYLVSGGPERTDLRENAELPLPW